MGIWIRLRGSLIRVKREYELIQVPQPRRAAYVTVPSWFTL